MCSEQLVDIYKQVICGQLSLVICAQRKLIQSLFLLRLWSCLPQKTDWKKMRTKHILFSIYIFEYIHEYKPFKYSSKKEKRNNEKSFLSLNTKSLFIYLGQKRKSKIMRYLPSSLSKSKRSFSHHCPPTKEAEI